MSRTIIDINILQTVPPSNLNRDDTGSPKTAIYGGVSRARVSSQAWKRATRKDFESRLDRSELGTRTKRVVELLAERIVETDRSITPERAEELATLAFPAAGIKLSAPRRSTKENPLPEESGYLLFLSSRQIDRLAAAAIEANGSDDAAAALKAAGLKKSLDLDHSVDLALFGRMVADASDLNVDAAAQVAHAISVHSAATEFDYFTAVDDHKNADDEEDAGAGMIGVVEFTSSTLYRYATVDGNRLLENLGDARATRRAVEAFVQSFSRSLPSGKQNTFANRTLPDAIVISVRDTQSVNLVGAFEEAITDQQRLKRASTALAEHAAAVDEAYGTTPVATWVVRAAPGAAALDALGERVSLDEAVSRLGDVVAERLQASS
ncbi:CRISPR system Cascade subunit CasC [Microbacterium resistens]|uniref:CRISPR system Cascade subunit CasC n=1 Tax=Microbacterium resistens TaxID=156977 RepID=A0ABU1SBX7_9MICO|nr:type I-E CRISPR-associated protein Cas7/Cse4/CasC [Microbacterium resistens]MDR6867119.1 CRISPR system Cascade subunit CasC [Microbacterium resistens]